MDRITKITSSIGPKSETKDVLLKMIKSGVNVCRLNFSHDVGEVQGRKIKLIREISKELNKPVAVLVDLQGPKHRIGNFETDDRYPLTIGQKFIFDNDPTPGNSTRVYLPEIEVIKSLKVGDRILLDDAKIEMKVEKVLESSIEAVVIRGSEIWYRRGFNLPDTEINSSILTDKDKEDLKYALTQNPDFIAISFVQKPEDIIEVKNLVKSLSNHPVKIIAKIERPQAVERIKDIIDVADGIMIARGDLAVEVPFETVPMISRNIVRLCRENNKPVIMATQMLGSMVNNAFPTRAEISDIATAAYLKVDSTMTSEETTVGEHPVFVVETMSKILKNADLDAVNNEQDWSDVDDLVENDWALSVVAIAELNSVSAIVVFADDTDITTKISCRRPNVPIIAICNNETIANQLCLSRGVFSIYDNELFNSKDVLNSLSRFNIADSKVVVVDNYKITLHNNK